MLQHHSIISQRSSIKLPKLPNNSHQQQSLDSTLFNGNNRNKREQFHLNKSNNSLEQQQHVIVNHKKQYHYHNHQKNHTAIITHQYYEPNIKNQQLKTQIKSMRKLLKELNMQLNRKLNIYQLAILDYIEESKNNKNNKNNKTTRFTNSEQTNKQIKLLTSQNQLNNKIIKNQQKQLNKMIHKNIDLEQYDYLIQLEEKTNIIILQINQKKKQKYRQHAHVSKLDSRLIQMKVKKQSKETQEQINMMKVIKHQIFHYFKQYLQNKGIIEDLNKQLKQLKLKDQELNSQYQIFTVFAAKSNMLVKANSQYQKNIKIQNNLQSKCQRLSKNIEILQFSFLTNQDKINNQMTKLRQQIAQIDHKIVETNQISMQFVQTTNNLIENNKVDKASMGLSYQFTEIQKNTDEIVIDHNLNNHKSQKYYIKPKINIKKLKHRRDYSNSVNSQKSAEITSRYQTIQQTQALLSQKKSKVRNKGLQNNQTISMLESDRNMSLKPNLRIKSINKEERTKNKKLKDKEVGQLNPDENKMMISLEYQHTRLKKLNNKSKIDLSKKKQETYLL